jgi:hypothetical protein
MITITGIPIAQEIAVDIRNLSAAAVRVGLFRERYVRFQRYRARCMRTSKVSSPAFSIIPSGEFVAIHVPRSASLSAEKKARRIGAWMKIPYARETPTAIEAISKLLSMASQLDSSAGDNQFIKNTRRTTRRTANE